MAKVTLNAKASAILTSLNANNADLVKAINTRRNQEVNNPDAELSELDLLNKYCTEGLNELDKQCNAELKGVTSVSVIKVTKARYKLLKEEMKAEFEKEMEPLRLSTDVINVVAEEVPYQKTKEVMAKVAAPFKVLKGAANGVVDGLGLRGFWNR